MIFISRDYKVEEMQEVFTSQHASEINFFKSVLDAEGIACFVRKEDDGHINYGVTNWPVLCVSNEADYEKAARVLKARRVSVIVNLEEWICRTCMEKNPPNFEVCWSCGTAWAEVPSC